MSSPDFIDRHRTSIGLALIALIISGSAVSLYTLNAQNQTPGITLNKGNTSDVYNAKSKHTSDVGAEQKAANPPESAAETSKESEGLSLVEPLAEGAGVLPAQTEVININVASAKELEAAGLYRIGPKTAAKIVEYREQNGPFKTIEEIMEVKGIAEKTFEKIKDRISVD